MPANKIILIGPVALTNTLTTNIINPPTLTGGIGLSGTNTNTYLIIRHIRITNKTGTAVSFSLWLGATGANTAGTEVIGSAKFVAANDAYDWYGMLRLDVNQFVVGGASANTALTLQCEAEIGVV